MPPSPQKRKREEPTSSNPPSPPNQPKKFQKITTPRARRLTSPLSTLSPPSSSTQTPPPAAPAPCLRNHHLLHYKFHVLLYDLYFATTTALNIPTASGERLHAFPLTPGTLPSSSGYFTREETQIVLSLPSVATGRTISEDLQARYAENDGVLRGLWSSIDVSQVLEMAIGKRGRELEDDWGFLKMLENKGLVLLKGDVWTGLGTLRLRG